MNCKHILLDHASEKKADHLVIRVDIFGDEGWLYDVELEQSSTAGCAEFAEKSK